MTRRHWILATGATAVAAAQPKSSSLPPSLSALKSRRSEAKPITNTERQARIERAQRLMKDNHLDAICLMGGTSLEYFANIRWGLSERLFFMVIPQRGEPFFVSPAFEEERAREQIAKGPAGTSAHVLKWQEDDSPYEKVAFGLKERGVLTGHI